MAGTTPIRETGAVAEQPGKAERTCRPVRAMATGFGERNVSDFAEGNLSLAIDKAKDEMASEGAKGFSVEGRAVKCEFYIDFGGSMGREHKCHASAQLCGKNG